jgi:hypothetical protein
VIKRASSMRPASDSARERRPSHLVAAEPRTQPTSLAGEILHLQRTFGNRATAAVVQRMLKGQDRTKALEALTKEVEDNREGLLKWAQASGDDAKDVWQIKFDHFTGRKSLKAYLEIILNLVDKPLEAVPRLRKEIPVLQERDAKAQKEKLADQRKQLEDAKKTVEGRQFSGPKLFQTMMKTLMPYEIVAGKRLLISVDMPGAEPNGDEAETVAELVARYAVQMKRAAQPKEKPKEKEKGARLESKAAQAEAEGVEDAAVTLLIFQTALGGEADIKQFGNKKPGPTGNTFIKWLDDVLSIPANKVAYCAQVLVRKLVSDSVINKAKEIADE